MASPESRSRDAGEVYAADEPDGRTGEEASDRSRWSSFFWGGLTVAFILLQVLRRVLD